MVDIVLKHGFRLLKEIALGHEWVIALVHGGCTLLMTVVIWDALEVGRHFSAIAHRGRPVLKASKSFLFRIGQMLCAGRHIFLFFHMDFILSMVVVTT